MDAQRNAREGGEGGRARAGSGSARLRIAIAKPRRGWGGGTTMALAIAEHLRSRGHGVVVLCHPRAPLRERARERGFPVEPALAGRSFAAAAIARSLLALGRRRPDVLLAFVARPGDAIFGVPAARLLGIPVVVRFGLSGVLRFSALERRILRGAARLVGVSHAIARELAAILPERRDPPVTIHNGVDVERFAAARPAELGLPPGAVAVGFVGRLHREKGVFDLAAAWPVVADAVPHAHLVLVGEGPHEAALRAALAGAPRVRWLGFRADAAEVHRALDLLVLPTYREGFPNTVIEAMAAGKPVVATSVDGPVEAVEDGVTGRLVPPGDPVSLAAALVELARDPAARRRLGGAGAERARVRFARMEALQAYESLLVEADARKGATPRIR